MAVSLSLAVAILPLALTSSPGARGWTELSPGTETSAYHGDTARAAIERTIHACGLQWSMENPLGLKDGSPIQAAVSANGRFCLLTRPYSCDGCDGDGGAVALVDNFGLRWTRGGRFLTGSRISAAGFAALFRSADGPRPMVPLGSHYAIELLILSVDGDSVLTRTWVDHLWEPFGSGPVYGFSEEGRQFLYSARRAPLSIREGNAETILYGFDLEDGSCREFNVGKILVERIEFYPSGARVVGRPPMPSRWSNPPPEGEFWLVTWSPWAAVRHDDRTLREF